MAKGSTRRVSLHSELIICYFTFIRLSHYMVNKYKNIHVQITTRKTTHIRCNIGYIPNSTKHINNKSHPQMLILHTLIFYASQLSRIEQMTLHNMSSGSAVQPLHHKWSLFTVFTDSPLSVPNDVLYRLRTVTTICTIMYFTV